MINPVFSFVRIDHKRSKYCFIDGPNRCETAYLTFKCYFETAPEVSDRFNESNEKHQLYSCFLGCRAAMNQFDSSKTSGKIL